MPKQTVTTIETLALSLAAYCTADDAALPRKAFLKMVADRITEDLGTDNESSAP